MKPVFRMLAGAVAAALLSLSAALPAQAKTYTIALGFRLITNSRV